MTLCIVDMQPDFRACIDVVDNVLQQVKIAKDNREGIVLLEYEGYGHADERILWEVKQYDRQTILSKNEDDGSNEFLSAAQSLGFWLGNIKFCGVNACYCVWETFWSTANAMLREKPNFQATLVADAVNCTCGPRDCIQKYRGAVNDRGAKNVSIINVQD